MAPLPAVSQNGTSQPPASPSASCRQMPRSALAQLVFRVDTLGCRVSAWLGEEAAIARQVQLAELQQGIRWQLYGLQAPAPPQRAALRRRSALISLRAETAWSRHSLLAQLRYLAVFLGGAACVSAGARMYLAQALGCAGGAPWAWVLLTGEWLVGGCGQQRPLLTQPTFCVKPMPVRPSVDAGARTCAEFETACAQQAAPIDGLGRAMQALETLAVRALLGADELAEAIVERGIAGALLERPVVAAAMALERSDHGRLAHVVWALSVCLSLSFAGARAALSICLHAMTSVLGAAVCVGGQAASWGMLELARCICALGGRLGSARAAHGAQHLERLGCEPVRLRYAMARDPIAADANDALRTRGRLELTLGDFARVQRELVALYRDVVPRDANDTLRIANLRAARLELASLLEVGRLGAAHTSGTSDEAEVAAVMEILQSSDEARAAQLALGYGPFRLLRPHIIDVGSQVLPRVSMQLWVLALYCKFVPRRAARCRLRTPPERAMISAFVRGVVQTLELHTGGRLLERARYPLQQLFTLIDALQGAPQWAAEAPVMPHRHGPARVAEPGHRAAAL